MGGKLFKSKKTDETNVNNTFCVTQYTQNIIFQHVLNIKHY